VLASLNHQHIAQIYGLEESGERRALVMELVEGETLADVLARGPIDVDESLSIARQIAEALEAAHDAGIVHRDLKPGNIKLRPDGAVKVLDFGLATYAANPGVRGPSESADSPTFTSPVMSEAGIILGTAAYMSPEQARGKLVDRRTDVCAFGCVLYEMLTGRVAFGGETVSDVIGSVLRADPDWTRLPATTPAAVRTLLRRCVEKDFREPLPHLGVARLDLRQRDTERSPAKRQRVSPAVLSVVAAVGVTVGAALTMTAVSLRREEAPSLGPVHMVLFPPAGATSFGQNAVGLRTGAAAPSFALSRDGRKLAFTAVDPDNAVSLWVRSLASPDAEKLPDRPTLRFRSGRRTESSWPSLRTDS
jgi:serine/threonine protein kinase